MNISKKWATTYSVLVFLCAANVCALEAQHIEVDFAVGGKGDNPSIKTVKCAAPIVIEQIGQVEVVGHGDAHITEAHMALLADLLARKGIAPDAISLRTVLPEDESLPISDIDVVMWEGSWTVEPGLLRESIDQFSAHHGWGLIWEVREGGEVLDWSVKRAFKIPLTPLQSGLEALLQPYGEYLQANLCESDKTVVISRPGEERCTNE